MGLKVKNIHEHKFNVKRQGHKVYRGAITGRGGECKVRQHWAVFIM